MNYLKKTVSQFIDDDGTTMAAALAYFSLFALPPLLLVMISVAGLFFGQSAAEGEIQSQIQQFAGPDASHLIATMFTKAAHNTSSAEIAGILGLIALFYGATSAFSQLQSSLNTIWRVKRDPRAGSIKNFLINRVFAFIMMVALALLLLASLVVDAALTGMGGVITPWLPGSVSTALLQAATAVISFLVVLLLFAVIFKVLPDANLRWKQVWVGATVTAILFTAGKFGIAYYLGKSGEASLYGAAGSLVLIVLWLYYSSIIVLLGAEFTRVWVESHGVQIQPKKGAVRTKLAA